MEKNRPKIDNRFVAGMNGDNDIQYQPKDTYRDAVNMRVLFNEDGGLSIENDKGNKLSFTLVDYNGDVLTDYIPVGQAAFADKVVLFSTNEENSEIGFVTVDADGIGTYTQVFNDKYDPNGDKLGFKKRNNIEAKAVKETDDIERVYWTDYTEQFSVINIQLGASFSYTPTGVVFLEYPFWYSVHSFRIYCDWDMGIIKYKERIEGNLKTGVYQYAYRQGTKDGYRTPFFPLTRHFIMNSQPFDSSYQMQPSNQVTDYGFRLEISGIDTRFPILEVAYVYSISETQTVDAAIFYSEEVNIKYPAATKTIDHITNAGEPISFDEFNTRLLPIRKVKTIEEKDNILFAGGVKEVGVLEPDLSEATITAITRNMEADKDALDTSIKPYATDAIVDTVVYVNNYGSTQTEYPIKNEPATYRGTAFEHLFTSYWRGETYRIGVMLFDRKGMPNYVFHLDDYTFPEQYDGIGGNYTLTVNDGGTLKIRLLGMEISGIKIPVEILYDEDDNLNISGFSIVRARRVEETLFQGVLMNTVYENDDTTVNGTAHWKYTRPNPLTENFFNGHITPVAGSYPNNALQLKGVKATTDKDFASRAGTALMYSPEIFFGYKATPEWTQNSNLKAVCVAGAAGQEYGREGFNRVFSSDAICHFYSKNYLTEPYWSNYFGTNLGDVTYIEQGGIFKTFLGDDFKIENYDVQKDDLIYTQYTQIDFDNTVGCSDCNVDKFGWGCPDSLLFIMKDFKDVSAGVDLVRNKVLIANFRKPADSYFSGEDENALEKTIYISTGHFQPINNTVIAETEDADGNLVFNNVEVWGGDCYPSYFGFTRILPQYRSCDTDNVGGTDCYLDYSVSMIVPLESNINYSLRIGRTFPKDGVEPENTSCGDISLALLLSNKGIQEKQREDFNINSVLQHEENVQFFNAKPTTIVNRTENPMTVIHSETKYYGEPLNNYRRYLANNYFDLTGANGDITKLFSQYSYIYFLQTKGFGRLYINQPTTLNSPETGSIIVGSGGILTGALYISQDIGSQHQFSVIGGHNQTYWVDVNLGKMYRFSQNGLSPISDKGQHNRIYSASKYFKNKDNPAGFSGITGIYDYKNNEIIYSFHAPDLDRSDIPFLVYNFTLVYSENTETFTTRFSEVPHFYFSLQGKYFSSNVDSPQDFYVHLLGNRGQYYGEYKDATVDIVVNPTQDAQKVYDITQVNMNDLGVARLSQVEISTDNQTFSLSLPTDARARYRYGFLSFPVRELTQTDRTRGKWMKQKYTIVNNGDLCRITMIENKFRIAYPI